MFSSRKKMAASLTFFIHFIIDITVNAMDVLFNGIEMHIFETPTNKILQCSQKIYVGLFYY